MEASNVKYIARTLNKSAASIRKFLNGEREPNKDTIIAWAYALRVDLSEIWEDEPTQNQPTKKAG
jgi:transcriptional regulator with XRE-family HTH domain